MFTFLRWAPWALAAAAGVFTLWALLAQVETTEQLGAAMQGVKANVAQAKELTAETARVLAPLAHTADTLAAMNKGLEATVGDLKAMNESMGRVLVRQEGVLTRIDSLNSHTGTLVTDLAAVDTKNQALLGAARAMTVQTAGQAASIEELAGLTGTAITYLGRLNDRFAFLAQY